MKCERGVLCEKGAVTKKGSFNIYNSANLMKSKYLALITTRFCPYMVPVPAAVKAEIGGGGSGKTDYVDNNFTPTIASNLLEANAVLPWQASGQRAKRFGPLLCATIDHLPACYARQCLLFATHHAAECWAHTCAREAVTNM
jgi:hypothetical protein